MLKHLLFPTTQREAQHIDDMQGMPIVSKIHAALVQLLEAYEYALDTHRDVWDFAIEVADFKAAGLGISDLRWLMSKGYIEAAHEVTQSTSSARKFQREKNLALSNAACFILTEKGIGLARTVRDGFTVEHSIRAFSKDSERIDLDRRAPRPQWDGKRRTLCVGQCVVKQYRLPSPNQVAILTAFQEEGWPHRIDDPIPPSPEQDPKRRLHDTIKCLNRHQLASLICFRGDGTGEGVLWEWIEAPFPAAVGLGKRPRRVA